MGVMKRITMSMGVLGVALVAAPQAHGQSSAVITNGTITLGVNAGGALNVNCGAAANATNTTRCTTDAGVEAGPGGGVGLYNNVTHNEATFDGCTCEGWGAGVSGGAHDGLWDGQNTAGGGAPGGGAGPNGTVGTFTFDATSATSTVTINDVTGAPVMSVVQNYHPSASAGLYQVDVTITNLTNDILGSGPDGIRYRREMDWDIEPTNTFEYSTINGNGAANLLGTGDDGFDTSNPFATPNSICAPIDTDFQYSGPCDHGALFDFGFDALAVGASKSFTIFYGAAANVADALNDLAAVGADNVYSLSEAGGTGANGGGSESGDYTNNCGSDTACIAAKETFIFGFKGVGGTTVTGTPEPASIALMSTGLLGLAGFARRRRASKES